MEALGLNFVDDPHGLKMPRGCPSDFRATRLNSLTPPEVEACRRIYWWMYIIDRCIVITRLQSQFTINVVDSCVRYPYGSVPEGNWTPDSDKSDEPRESRLSAEASSGSSSSAGVKRPISWIDMPRSWSWEWGDEKELDNLMHALNICALSSVMLNVHRIPPIESIRFYYPPTLATKISPCSHLAIVKRPAEDYLEMQARIRSGIASLLASGKDWSSSPTYMSRSWYRFGEHFSFLCLRFVHRVWPIVI
jgi:hypothetical protein